MEKEEQEEEEEKEEKKRKNDPGRGSVFHLSVIPVRRFDGRARFGRR